LIGSELALVAAAAFVAGFVDSIVGGGGLVQVPALFAAYPGAPPATLLGTNKLGSIFGTGTAVARYAAAIRIPWRALLPVMPLASAAAFMGAMCVHRVPAGLFRPLVPLMLGCVLIYVLWRKDLGGAQRMVRLTTLERAATTLLLAVIGFYDGFFGPGTGSFLMLVFIRMHGLDFLNASACARAVNLASNFGALAYFTLQSQVLLQVGFALALCNAAGSIAGTRLALRRGNDFVRVLFITIVGVLIVKTAADAIRLH
jgi:uncharacterized protein